MISLLSHANSDVAAAVLSVLVEWTDPALLLSTTSTDDDAESTSGASREATRSVGRLALALLTIDAT
jgi:hypothetical protein